MKRLLSVIAATLFCSGVHAQITITTTDMPLAGDMLVYSNVSPTGASINEADSGASVIWNYVLTPISQGIDTYQTAASVNLLYLVTVGSIKQVYTFFEEKTVPDRFEAKAFAANISGLPTAANYSKPDIWYFLPLDYHNTDSSPIALKLPIPGLDTLVETGSRQTRVDGWGKITTPYFTVPVNCLRVRSEVDLVDSVSVFGFKVGFPRNTVEYKWLANGYHYPVLWVTRNLAPGGGSQIASIRYLDTLRSTDTTVIDTNVAVHQVNRTNTEIKAYPNPMVNGLVHLSLPGDWTTFYVEVFDLTSKQVATFKNERELNLQSLPAGNYIARVMSGEKIAYVQITR